MLRPGERLEAGDVTLRRWRYDDLEPLLAATRESWEHLRPWLPWAAERPTVESQAGFLRASVTAWQEGTAFQYGVFDASGAVVGGCGLERRIGPSGLEIGYWVRVGCTGRGIARAAARTVADAAFALPDVDHVEIHCDEANTRSAAVPRALGFTLAETHPREVTAPGEVGREMVWRLARPSRPAAAPGPAQP